MTANALMAAYREVRERHGRDDQNTSRDSRGGSYRCSIPKGTAPHDNTATEDPFLATFREIRESEQRNRHVSARPAPLEISQLHCESKDISVDGVAASSIPPCSTELAVADVVYGDSLEEFHDLANEIDALSIGLAANLQPDSSQDSDNFQEAVQNIVEHSTSTRNPEACLELVRSKSKSARTRESLAEDDSLISYDEIERLEANNLLASFSEEESLRSDYTPNTIEHCVLENFVVKARTEIYPSGSASSSDDEFFDAKSEISVD